MVVREIAFDDTGVGALDLVVGGREATRVILGVGNGGTSSGTVEYSLRLEDASRVEADAPTAPSTTIFGTGTFVSGRVFCGGVPAPFARVVLTQTEVASGTTSTTDLTTDAFGQWSVTTLPEVTSSYSVHVVDPLISPASSASSTVGVKVAVNMALSADQVAEDEPITVEGNVAPVHAGLVQLEYRRPNGRFEIGPQTAVDAEGRYRFDFVLPGPGVWEVRTTMPDTGDDDHLPGDSAPKLVQVGET